jgi:hypothetical protein
LQQALPVLFLPENVCTTGIVERPILKDNIIIIIYRYYDFLPSIIVENTVERGIYDTTSHEAISTIYALKGFLPLAHLSNDFTPDYSWF